MRQGEWFFLAQWTVEVDEHRVLRDEPLTRGRGKAHLLEYAFRRGGETVFVNAAHPTGISAGAFASLPQSQVRKGVGGRWSATPSCTRGAPFAIPTMRRSSCTAWHRVLMNTEQSARAMRHVAFID